jgi:uncharacterized repeat protein (TIGR01451 family)
MKRLLLGTLIAAATGASMAAVSLVPTLSTPTELQLGEYAVYRLAVKNNASIGATGVALRMPLPVGMTVQLPLPSLCAVVTEAFLNQYNVRQLRCSPGLVPARATRAYSVVIQAPALPQTVTHQMVASATGLTPSVVANPATHYQHFDLPIAGGSLWEIRSCANGSAGPIAYNICPASSEIVGDVELQTGGGVLADDGSTGVWMQNNPHVARIDWTDYGSGGFVTNLSVIDSKCFRGPGVSVPPPGTPIWYAASKICLK